MRRALAVPLNTLDGQRNIGEPIAGSLRARRK